MYCEQSVWSVRGQGTSGVRVSEDLTLADVTSGSSQQIDTGTRKQLSRPGIEAERGQYVELS